MNKSSHRTLRDLKETQPKHYFFTMSTDKKGDSDALERALDEFNSQTLKNRFADLQKSAVFIRATGCLLVDPKLKQTREGADYVRISISEMRTSGDGRKQKAINVFAHVLSYWCHTDSVPDKDLDLSHICGNGRCFQFKHLVLEAHDVNLTRLCCHKYLNKHPNYVCPHMPNCIV